jgi:hypothetical protein
VGRVTYWRRRGRWRRRWWRLYALLAPEPYQHIMIRATYWWRWGRRWRWLFKLSVAAIEKLSSLRIVEMDWHLQSSITSG